MGFVTTFKCGDTGKLLRLPNHGRTPMNPDEIFCPNIACPAKGGSEKETATFIVIPLLNHCLRQ
jgi:hypothetical protein